MRGSYTNVVGLPLFETAQLLCRPRLPNAMPGELLIAAGPGEWRAALLEDGIPVELFVERGDRSEAGSIHLGRVHRLLPALGAMLVDIGGDRPAFLPQNEVFPRGRRLDEGERVIVQIRREAQGGKAASVTTVVALRGKLIELRSGGRGIVGGETLSPEERARLLRCRRRVDGRTLMAKLGRHQAARIRACRDANRSGNGTAPALGRHM